jgi:hypothetical protein
MKTPGSRDEREPGVLEGPEPEMWAGNQTFDAALAALATLLADWASCVSSGL